MMRKSYIDGPHGQIHIRVYEADRSVSHPDLYMLHPAPFSGLAFQNLAPLLATDRRVIAPDYPGYGGSDALSLTPRIDDYADAMMAVVDAISSDQPVDVLGFHTGCLVAAEIAFKEPSRVRKACLIDCPAFAPEVSASLAEKNGAPFEISDDLASLDAAWKRGVTSRLGAQPPEQAFAMFVEHLRPGRGMNSAFHAAFSYPWQERFAELQTRVMVLATQSMLLEGSRAAASAIPGAELRERLDIKRSVLDEAADLIAEDTRRFFS